MPAPPLPLVDPETTTKAPAERRKGEYVFPPLALLDAPKTERKIDERELMDGARLLEEKCREFAVEGTIPDSQHVLGSIAAALPARKSA